MNVMIVGANFENKGAQSMLFITIDEIKKRLPTAEVYYAGVESFDMSRYAFKRVFYSESAKKIALYNSNAEKLKCFAKDCVKLLLLKKNNLWKYNDLKNLIGQIDLMIDISGFNLGKKWSADIQQSYLNNIKLAKKYGIPFIIMPQSFGPFDYPEDERYLLDEIADCLPYAQKIFAREEEGFNMLKSSFNLENVELSTDLVLQNREINLKNIFRDELSIDVPDIPCGSVAVVPNAQCWAHGDRNTVSGIYKSVIERLVEKGKKIYIFRHSNNDKDVCEEIYSDFSDNADVNLIDRDFSCLEYDAFVRKFDFIVCSRYHGTVHAYRNRIPCLILGWAIKYRELACHLGQEKYTFDITDNKTDVGAILSAADAIAVNYENDARIIESKLADIQKNNCFCILDNWNK